MEVSVGRWTSKSGAREQGLSCEASGPVNSIRKAQGTLEHRLTHEGQTESVR